MTTVKHHCAVIKIGNSNYCMSWKLCLFS